MTRNFTQRRAYHGRKWQSHTRWRRRRRKIFYAVRDGRDHWERLSRDRNKYAEKEEVMSQPYCKSVTYETDYDADMTVEAAYDYLKTLEMFEGAEDI